MKCTNNNQQQRRPMSKHRRMVLARKRRRQRQLLIIGCSIFLVLLILIGLITFVKSRSGSDYALAYETEHYNKSLFKGEVFAKDLCVTADNISLEGFSDDASLNAAGLFDLNNKQVLYADRIHDRLYPASTTKIMTAYIALKYGNMDDIVTISENAVNLGEGAQMCGFDAGDKVRMYDLMCGLLLYSGNDAAVAIAEQVSGSVEAFAEKMNEEAISLGATNTHFVNPHGLHDENHYTTAYDLYLMFNACVQDSTFIEIISMKSYTATITSQDDSTWTTEWIATNYYSAGEATPPEDVNVLGGKTGTTDEAGSCVILYNQDMESNPYISIIMGANDKTILYDDMSQILATGVAKSTK